MRELLDYIPASAQLIYMKEAELFSPKSKEKVTLTLNVLS